MRISTLRKGFALPAVLFLLTGLAALAYVTLWVVEGESLLAFGRSEREALDAVLEDGLSRGAAWIRQADAAGVVPPVRLDADGNGYLDSAEADPDGDGLLDGLLAYSSPDAVPGSLSWTTGGVSGSAVIYDAFYLAGADLPASSDLPPAMGLPLGPSDYETSFAQQTDSSTLSDLEFRGLAMPSGSWSINNGGGGRLTMKKGTEARCLYDIVTYADGRAETVASLSDYRNDPAFSLLFRTSWTTGPTISGYEAVFENVSSSSSSRLALYKLSSWPMSGGTGTERWLLASAAVPAMSASAWRTYVMDWHTLRVVASGPSMTVTLDPGGTLEISLSFTDSPVTDPRGLPPHLSGIAGFRGNNSRANTIYDSLFISAAGGTGVPDDGTRYYLVRASARRDGTGRVAEALFRRNGDKSLHRIWTRFGPVLDL
jgi:hypothetical protein